MLSELILGGALAMRSREAVEGMMSSHLGDRFLSKQ
jgi:hypothetical protein